ncbi:MAG: NAD(+)/NADH kinase [Acidobacteria bacterium]|nr:NAD(+)/NADH kinase [Acidobacteriota bacterium]
MKPPLEKIGIIVKKQDSRAQSLVKQVIPWLKSRQFQVFPDPAMLSPETADIEQSAAMVRQVDVVVVFGGDGTLLYGARLIGGTGIPIMGINLGSLGFLTEVKLEEMYAAFDVLRSGAYQTEERVLLDVEVVRGDNVLARHLALNDAVINKGALARIIELEVSVNSQPVLFTRADGLIVSTPTGSTAYSLAAGGPILYPTLEAFIIAPICPHTLTNRPVVIPDRDAVVICLRRGADVMLTVDGQVGTPIQPQDCVRIRRADSTLKLVLPFGNTFFNLLREKLRWG